jgi:hypothetical protein
MGVTLQTAELQGLAEPAVVVVPSPKRAGRYQVEIGDARPVSALLSHNCRCEEQCSRVLVWLTFVEDDQETGRELSDVICSHCEQGRFQWACQWAGLAAPEEAAAG